VSLVVGGEVDFIENADIFILSPGYHYALNAPLYMMTARVYHQGFMSISKKVSY
jgi:hypothetical protein